jgi:hypothetical protein
MNRLRFTGLALLFFFFATGLAMAGDFDGSQPLLCAVIDVIECAPGSECQEVTAEAANIPQFLEIDFVEKKISGSTANGGERTTAVERMQQIEGKLILQGAEDGLGWTVAISEETGKMALTASGEDVGFVVFGACMVK